MDKLRKSFRSSFRKKSHQEDIDNRTVTWPKDEAAVKTNTCSFDVKYLGSVEVFESRGMQVCEEALKLLKNSKRRYIRGTLHVSGDGLRVVDKDTKGLVLDQTIEKVSFCAPDRSYEKGFSYICRDGTTRRWMCHGFLAVGDSGERLSHAVGCAFAICLERKQMREKESVQYHYNKKDNVFTRFGSFQQGSIHDRLKDPQEFKPGLEPPKPAEPVDNPNAVPRPRPSDMYLRQASMRGGRIPGAANSLFKRQYSLRLEELPSTLSRQKSVYNNETETSGGNTCTTIQEDSLSPTKDFSSLPPISTNMITSTPMVKGVMVDATPAKPSLQIAPLTAPPVLDGDVRIGPFQTPTSGAAIINRNTTAAETNLLCTSSGPVSLPVNLSGSTVTPISVLTDDIPMELPPPILSPTLGTTTLSTQQKSNNSSTSKNVWSKPSTSSQSDILPVFDTFNLGANKSICFNSTNNNDETKAFNPFTSPDPFTSLPIDINRIGSSNSNGPGPVPPLPPRSSNPPPLPNRLSNPSTSSCMSPLSGGAGSSSQRSLDSVNGRCSKQGGESVILRQSHSLAPAVLSSRGSLSLAPAALSSGGSQGSGLVMEGFNPWDNVPDQPIIRTSGGMTVKSGRPVSMIEQESMSKAAGQPTPTMERGYSLEASIDTTNHYNDDLSYNNLFTMPGESDSSSGFLRDPFDSDWADRALKTGSNADWTAEKAFKTGSCDDWTVKSFNNADFSSSNPDWTVQSGSNADWTNEGKSSATKQLQDKNDNNFKSFELHL